MTDHHLLEVQANPLKGKGRYPGVEPGAVRVVCDCGWTGIWMTPYLDDADGNQRSAIEYAEEVLIPQLRATHPNPDDPDPEEERYQRLLQRMRDEGHIA